MPLHKSGDTLVMILISTHASPVLAVIAGDDAGKPIATTAVLLAEAPVPGRKVTWP